ncbi:nucleoside hydrolase-like domain-containing protein [Rhodopirellula halodulae]|uniref:nucleoside hydrolase-like domain-containing protein n=1 Tax=Rhodopirellula halodulae TaxID=2894198 RepID=UPI001E445E27|nr:nucleoside hydrolase-like domain-containing protein [Rhodopirellula sp. JC737]MCC9654298.1 DUF1593 domain-containing protein [Rhodopirellula sp. JC737]
MRLVVDRFLVLLVCVSFGCVAIQAEEPSSQQDPNSNGLRPRVIVSTDIGGTDPDDFQSMVHLLVYADRLDLEGLISSPFGEGRVEDLLDVVDCYEKDFTNLRSHSDQYPTANVLRAICKQGETEVAPHAGVRRSTEGSDWIIRCAKREDSRPLHVLVWGGLEDLAQALHDDPSILPRLRVYWIGGPNKKWSPDAYQYLVDHHPTLWMIESNSAYRGWFTGGNQKGEWENESFVRTHVKDFGELGRLFAAHKMDLKMGDTPSLARLLNGVAEDPTAPSWGGRYVRAWRRPRLVLERMPTASDRMEVFGILELNLSVEQTPANPEAKLLVENQALNGHFAGDGTVRFRFCPKAAKQYDFRIKSNVKSLDGLQGEVRAVSPERAVTSQPDDRLPQWWTDDPSSDVAEGPHAGAKTVSQWREAYLEDFAERMKRCVKETP